MLQREIESERGDKINYELNDDNPCKASSCF